MPTRSKGPRPRKGRTPIERLETYESGLEALKFEVHGYALGVFRLRSTLKDMRKRLPDLRCLQPLRDYLDNIQGSMQEGCGWILDYQDDKMTFTDLQWNLQYDTAMGLESILDETPVLFQMVPAGIPAAIEEVLDDLEEFGESLSEEIRGEGYKLHSILIGAA
jgi:hypothetical protein